jgi:SAM-dependent methyltransferase
MNSTSALKYVRRLASLDIQAWRYLPYKTKMKMRGIDLSLVSVEQIGLSHERSHMHSDSGGPDLKRLLNTLPIDNSDAVIDLGCGKGGAMLTLAQHPFSRVGGVEIAENLAAVARKNIEKLRIPNAFVFCCDAADFVDLDAYTYVYMYNPFPQLVMSSVLDNINESLVRRNRTLTLVYRNPVFDALLLEYGFTKVLQTQQPHPDYPAFAVYLASGTTASLNQHDFTDSRTERRIFVDEPSYQRN